MTWCKEAELAVVEQMMLDHPNVQKHNIDQPDDYARVVRLEDWKSNYKSLHVSLVSSRGSYDSFPSRTQDTIASPPG